MATTITRIDQSKVISNLDTYNHTALANSVYNVSIQLTEQPPSGISILLQQNSSTKASFSSPAAQQGVINLQVAMNCAINDVISIVISSSSASDQNINAIKGILNIHQGVN
jgi:hypothetical protein